MTARPFFVARKKERKREATTSQHAWTICINPVCILVVAANVSHQQRRILAQGHIKTHVVLGSMQLMLPLSDPRPTHSVASTMDAMTVCVWEWRQLAVVFQGICNCT
jgi:hypothetical protein